MGQRARGPRSLPGRRDVQVVVSGLQQSRARDSSPGHPVGLVVVTVDPEACPVVLTHPVHDRWVVEGCPEVGMVALTHSSRTGGAVPRSWAGADHSLCRLVGLAEEPPVPPSPRELGVRAFEVLDHRQTVHDHQVRHNVGVAIAARKATRAPRSCPATANRSWPRCDISCTTSRALARLHDCAWSGASGGSVDRPYPRRSRATTKWWSRAGFRPMRRAPSDACRSGGLCGRWSVVARMEGRAAA